MENELKQNSSGSSSKGWLWGSLLGIFITAIILIIVFIIIALIGLSYYTNEINDAKEKTVRSNVVLIRNEVLIKLNKDGLEPKMAIAQAIDDLNTDKDLRQQYSPFSEECKPFSSEICPGSVVVKLENETKISISGYDEDSKVLLQKNLIKGE